MKARRLRKLLTIFIILLLVLQYSTAFAAVTDYRQRQEIIMEWERHKPVYQGELYLEEPSITAPYKAGIVHDAYLQDAIKVMNYMRYLTGVPNDLVFDPDLVVQAQHGAVLLAASNFSHHPEKPDDMEQDFYDLGYKSTRSSNIAYGYYDISSVIKAFMADADFRNMQLVGHRRWIMQPQMRKTGFGFADSEFSRYTTMQVFDWSRMEPFDYNFLAWPNQGFFPTEYFKSSHPWSVSLNTDKYLAPSLESAKVTLTKRSSQQKWEMDHTNNEPQYYSDFFNVCNVNYGLRGTIIFRPFNIEELQGIYDVEISGIYNHNGEETKLSYSVNFFDMKENVDRIQGQSRYETAAAISQLGWQKADTVIIARGDDYADALAGVPLANALGGPILLTRSDTLSSATKADITRLSAEKVIILGGTAAISPTVESELKTMGLKVSRIEGDNRFATAAEVARKLAAITGSTEAAVAYGFNFPDALSVAAYAAQRGMPVLLTNTNQLPVETTKLLAELGIEKTYVIGGESVISEQVAAMLPSPERLAGNDRYATATEVANYFPQNSNHVFVATGLDFADAVTGAVLAAKLKSPLLLVRTQSIPSAVKDYLTANNIGQATVFGGTSAVNQSAKNQLEDLLSIQ